MLQISSAVFVKSAIKGVKKHSGKAYAKAKEDAVRRKELTAMRRQEREQIREQARAEQITQSKPRRSDRYVEGVSFNTTITEYIGEFDYIINDSLYKAMEQNGQLAKEFNKQEKSTKN